MWRFLYLLALLVHVGSHAQDIHYSMYEFSPLNMNPATVGQFNGTWRFTGNHRHQWKAVTVPFTTYSLSADTREFLDRGRWNGGIQINQDRAGDSRFNTFEFKLNAGYALPVNKDSTLTISIGIQPGISNRNIDYSSLQFDDQYNGFRYDAGLNNNENFLRSSRTYFNLGAGLLGRYRLNERIFLDAGIGAFNLIQPKQSFFNDQNIVLDTRFSFHASGDIYLNEKIDLLPIIRIMTQGKFNEWITGAKVRYTLQDAKGIYQAVYLGTYYRNRDATFITTGLDYNNWRFALSYDINISTLTPASNNRGAFELAFMYLLKIYRPSYVQRRICRDFM